jgi:hypothetical protein
VKSGFLKLGLQIQRKGRGRKARIRRGEEEENRQNMRDFHSNGFEEFYCLEYNTA